MKIIRLLPLVIFAQSICIAQQIETALYELPDVIFEEITAPQNFEKAYELLIRQPVDHENPEDGYFYQRCYLTHRSMESPLVMVTEGYQRNNNRIYELTNYLGANQIIVEHRYFGESVPDDPSFANLNLKQATADLHRINTLLTSIYAGPVVTTGISKGGMTTLYYKYVYPEDADVSVAYVAPVINAFKDERIYAFLDTVGSKLCRKKIFNFQTELLRNKEKYLPLLYWYYKGKTNHFESLGFDRAYELAVLEYSFSFWQMGHQCEDIPVVYGDEEQVLDHFLTVSGADFFSDEDLELYAPFYYQMGTEMGYYGYDASPFKDYIETLDDEPSAVFMPDDIKATYDPTLTKATAAWLRNEGDRIIYINGNKDTWSATKMLPNPGVDAISINVAGADHGRARIKNMSKEQLDTLRDSFEKWLNVEFPAEIR